ncbi:MAG: DUF5687 family protein [Bacteroidota bacterium]
MFRRLFMNNWKASRRSPVFGNSLWQKILVAFLAIYFLLNFLVLGFFTTEILEEVFPGASPFVKFNGLLIYYFLLDVMVRFLLQEYPVLSIQPYLTFPIPKNSLVHFVLQRSIPTFFNLLPLVIVVPFFFRVVLPDFGALAAVAWLITVVCFILLANFVGFYLKKTFNRKPVLSLLLLALLGAVYYLDTAGYLGLSTAFEGMMNGLMKQTYLAIIPLLLLVAAYQFVFNYLKKQLYLDSVSTERRTEEAGIYDFGFLSRFGQIGEMMQLEAKMLWRSKRSRTFVYMSALFLLYPLIFIGNPIMDSIGGKLALSIFVTGIFSFNYAQLLLSWHSMHFDFIITRNIMSKDLFHSKYVLLAGVTFGCYILTIPYVFLSKWFFYTLTVSMLFNIGWSIFMYMYVANYNSQKIDPGQGGAFNFEGFGAAHYVIIIPIIALPILIYYFPFGYLGRPFWGLAMVGIVGLLGILFREPILKLLVRHFEKRKHQIAADFRKQ